MEWIIGEVDSPRINLSPFWLLPHLLLIQIQGAMLEMLEVRFLICPVAFVRQTAINKLYSHSVMLVYGP